MSNGTKNIFIAHTPLQNLVAINIVNQFFKDEQYHNTLISSVPCKTKNVFNTIRTIRKNNNLKLLWDTYSAKIYIDKSVKTQACSFFISHTSGLLDNYIFYELANNNTSLEVNFFYDGILYFYEYKEPLKKIHDTRKKIGKWLGISYKFTPKIFPYNSSEIKAIYTVLPKFTLGAKNKLVKVAMQANTYEPNKRSALILGGKPSLLTNDEVKDIYKQMISIMTEQGFEVVFFKGHHADKSSNFERVVGANFTYKDITQNNPIEEVIETYKPTHIYSYPSTALVNLKAMYGDKIDINAFYIEDKKSDIDYMTPIFEELKINFQLL